MIRCAILDDYQSVALDLADWGRLAGRVRIEALGALARDQLAAHLAPYEVLVAMRERTAFDAELLAADGGRALDLLGAGAGCLGRGTAGLLLGVHLAAEVDGHPDQDGHHQ